VTAEKAATIAEETTAATEVAETATAIAAATV